MKTIFIPSCYFYITTTLKFFLFSALLLPTLAFVPSINIHLYTYFEDDLYLFLLLLLCYILIRGIYSFSVFFLTISTYLHFQDDFTVVPWYTQVILIFLFYVLIFTTYRLGHSILCHKDFIPFQFFQVHSMFYFPCYFPYDDIARFV